jgi:hypothetical protein
LKYIKKTVFLLKIDYRLQPLSCGGIMKESVCFMLVIGALSLATTPLSARIINIPDDFETIQAGIDEAEDGDTVLVAPGEYVENIDFLGKDIVIIGTPDNPEETVIDGDENGSVVVFANGETDRAVLTGFTLRNGTGTEFVDHGRVGGGIFFSEAATPRIRNVRVIDNHDTVYGAGVAAFNDAHPTITDCVISGNTCGNGGEGAGVFADWGGHYTLERVLISDNSGLTFGGVQLMSSLDNFLSQVTIVNNVSTHGECGGIGVACFEEGEWGGQALLVNCIVWHNIGAQAMIGYTDGEVPAMLTISYSDIEGGEDDIDVARAGAILEYGEGNINEDPLFVDPDENDYHLSEDSPCIDTGDPETSLDPDGSRADMGAFPFFHNGFVHGFVLDADDDNPLAGALLMMN